MRRWWLAGLLSLAACKTLPVTPPSTLRALENGGHLRGVPLALGEARVLNREDFVFDAKLNADGSRVAVSRLGGKGFHLSLFAGARVADPLLNGVEFDVEAVEFSPDGARVAAASRDGSVRIFEAATGQPLASWLTDEPLVSLAWSPDGAHLALGSARGLVTVIAASPPRFVTELRAHADEVRALAFTPDGTLVTASWDRTVQRFVLRESTSTDVRAHFEKKQGFVTFRVVLDQTMAATVALDARAPMVLVRTSLAQALGVDVTALTETTTVTSAWGQQLVKVSRGHMLSVKNLELPEVDFGVCDACVPSDAQLVLGGPVLQRLALVFDDAAQEVVVAGASKGLGLERRSSVTLPAPVNDLSLDAKGELAAVALSETKAQRNPDVYQREKRNEPEPEREWDCAARLELSTGKLLDVVRGHRGVVSTVALSPDGQTVVTGGWDRRVVLHGVTEARFGWSIRRVRFSRDGRWLVVGAWTVLNALGDHQSDPAAVVYEVIYR